MGACCGGKNYYPEIDDASSVAEIVKALKDKARVTKAKSDEVELYMKDHRNKPTMIDLDAYSDEVCEKKNKFLKEYVTALNDSAVYLGNNLAYCDLEKTKEQIHALYDCDLLIEDDKNYLNRIKDNLSKIVEIGKRQSKL